MAVSMASPTWAAAWTHDSTRSGRYTASSPAGRSPSSNDLFTSSPGFWCHTGPFAGLTLAPDADFYGTLISGDVFRISRSGEFALVHQFFPPSGPEGLIAALVPGTDGYLYDTWPTALVPRDAIFRINPTGDAEVLHTFPYYC